MEAKTQFFFDLDEAQMSHILSFMNTPSGLLPILPLRNTVVFPGLAQVVKVGRKGSVQALKQAEKNGFWILVTQQKHNAQTQDERAPEPNDLCDVGTLCRIDSMKGNAESGYQIVLQGVARRRLEEIHSDENGALVADGRDLPDHVDIEPATQKALVESLRELARTILQLLPMNTAHLQELLTNITDLSFLTFVCAGNMEMPTAEKQKILETISLKDRALNLLQTMQDFKAGLEVQNELRHKLNQKLGNQQRQSILREQMKAIRNELGEGDDVSREDELRSRIDKAGLPAEVEKLAKSEAQRLAEVGNQSPESHIIRNYLELLLSLPWNKTSENEEIDLQKARIVLEEDHYGLDKIKKRILQHLAVLKLRKDAKGSIMCFVGPPGVGKTSLGQSIARALGKKFVRVSLGGVRDDAEVRGHRRTYIGAMPGRIIQALKKAGERDPVFVLDEIDKLSRAFSGDPASALLEVLDPEQNSTFLDHYLDVGFDLSKVFFICTANNLENIPGPLLDRMEVIDLSGYTVSEKLRIAKDHLIPKVMKELGIVPSQIELSDEVLLRLINSYTREAGVRELQRKISSLLRAKAEAIIESKLESGPIRPTVLELEELLGHERFEAESALTTPLVGVVTGLAWTPVGGDILMIENNLFIGKGQLSITGQLGDVMKESAQIAMTLAKNYCPQFPFQNWDFHIHVPSGAIPKDGPSAGVTLLSSLISRITGRTVENDVAMTGEITLRGAVLPVGGIKDKVLAAHRAGIKKIFLPLKNQKDLKEIPEEVLKGLDIRFVQSTDELLENVFHHSFSQIKSTELVGNSPPSNTTQGAQ